MKYVPPNSSKASANSSTPLLHISPAKVLQVLVYFIILLFSFSSILSFLKYYQQKSTNIVHILLNFFYLDNENNVPTYFSSLFLLTASLLLLYISLHKFHSSSSFRFNWLALSGLFLLLSMDEFMSVHELMIEPVQEAFNTTGFLYYAWVIPGMVFAATVGLFFIRFLIHLKSRFRKRFMVAALMYLGGALGIEMLGGFIGYSQGTENFAYSMVANSEELLEMLGITFFIYSLLLYIQEALATDLIIYLRKPIKMIPLKGIREGSSAGKDRQSAPSGKVKLPVKERRNSSS